MPAAVIRPAALRIAAWHQREAAPFLRACVVAERERQRQERDEVVRCSIVRQGRRQDMAIEWYPNLHVGLAFVGLAAVIRDGCKLTLA